jgi:hypothetical protein
LLYIYAKQLAIPKCSIRKEQLRFQIYMPK